MAGINFKSYPNMTKLNIGNNAVCAQNFSNAFSSMRNLTGCSLPTKNIINMSEMFYNCYNLTGSPACGNKVTDMQRAYENCHKLTGAPACGQKVVNMQRAYANCYNLSGNAYFYSNSINDVSNCFYGRNTSRMLNIYIYNNTGSYGNTIRKIITSSDKSLVGAPITWEDDYDNKRYYNTQYNIYIYYTLK